MQELKEKYMELEKKYNETMEDLPNYIQGQAMRLTTKHIGKKDQEIQRLQEQINQLLNQQSSQGAEMETEEPKTRPERIEIEEVIPRQGTVFKRDHRDIQVLGSRFNKKFMIHLEI